MLRKRALELVACVIVVFFIIVLPDWIRRGPWFPLPAFVAVFGVIGAFAIAMRVRSRLNQPRGDPSAKPCPECNYDLRGNVSGRCPEYGARMEPVSHT